MDLNMNSLSEEPFIFNEEGLNLLKDTLEAVQIAFRKVCVLKEYIHDQLTLNKKMLAEDNIKIENEVDKVVRLVPEVSENVPGPSLEHPSTNTPWSENVPGPSLEHPSTNTPWSENVPGPSLERRSINTPWSENVPGPSLQRPSTNTPWSEDVAPSDNPASSVDLSSRKEDSSVPELSVINEDNHLAVEVQIFMAYRLKCATQSLRKLFERKQFKNFIVRDASYGRKSCIAVIFFSVKEDVNRALSLNGKMYFRGLRVHIQPYRNNSKNNRWTRFGHNISGESGSTPLNEKSGSNWSDNLYFYSDNPGQLGADNLNEDTEEFSSEKNTNSKGSCKNEPPKNRASYRNTSRKYKNYRYFKTDRYQNKTVRDNRGLNVNTSKPFGRRDFSFANTYSFLNEPSTASLEVHNSSQFQLASVPASKESPIFPSGTEPIINAVGYEWQRGVNSFQGDNKHPGKQTLLNQKGGGKRNRRKKSIASQDEGRTKRMRRKGKGARKQTRLENQISRLVKKEVHDIVKKNQAL